jgi:hypothetical protein
MVFYRGPSLVGNGGTVAADGNALAGSWSSNAYSAQWLTTAMLRYGVETWHLGVLCLIGNCFLMGAYLVIQVMQTLELYFSVMLLGLVFTGAFFSFCYTRRISGEVMECLPLFFFEVYFFMFMINTDCCHFLL